ncbi:hypothetical protein HZH66_008199 [Vespula vulgaris]|uniref:Uncharacterized protein n=1 Tax=Vespula vulgaris TaxID=7454 RepID=A0A834N357_VESVU|nr:hypothetical protein HZH66_008199 [Vespula vulgaris]
MLYRICDCSRSLETFMHLDGYAFIVRQRANCSSRDTMAPETGQDFVIQTDREYRIVMVRYSLVALRQQFISQQHRKPSHLAIRLANKFSESLAARN